jgi:hypothetical protein
MSVTVNSYELLNSSIAVKGGQNDSDLIEWRSTDTHALFAGDGGSLAVIQGTLDDLRDLYTDLTSFLGEEQPPLTIGYRDGIIDSLEAALRGLVDFICHVQFKDGTEDGEFLVTRYDDAAGALLGRRYHDSTDSVARTEDAFELDRISSIVVV